MSPSSSLQMGKYEIMFYNALVTFIPAVCIAWLTGDLNKVFNYNHYDISTHENYFIAWAWFVMAWARS